MNMGPYEFLPIQLLLKIAYWAVTTLESFVEPVVGSESAAIAIVLFTIGIRLLLIPVGVSQVKAGVARTRMAPKVAELRRRYHKNPEMIQRKTMALYAEEKVSPFAGCLPVLAQAPVLMAVYGLFIRPSIDGHSNELLLHAFLGAPLDSGLLGLITDGLITWPAAAVFVAIIFFIAVVAQASRHLLAPSSPPPSESRPPGSPNPAAMMRVVSFIPFVTAGIAAFAPLAAGLYLLATTSWTLAERLVLIRILGAGQSRTHVSIDRPKPQR